MNSLLLLASTSVPATNIFTAGSGNVLGFFLVIGLLLGVVFCMRKMQ